MKVDSIKCSKRELRGRAPIKLTKKDELVRPLYKSTMVAGGAMGPVTKSKEVEQLRRDLIAALQNVHSLLSHLSQSTEFQKVFDADLEKLRG